MLDLKPYEPPQLLAEEQTAASPIVTLASVFGFAALFYLGFVNANLLLAMGKPVRQFLIAGLLCERGWREAIHAISPIVSLYPMQLSLCILLGVAGASRKWALGVITFALGFTASLVWMTSTGQFPSTIVSISPAPAGEYASAVLHGLSHVCLVPIGFRIGEKLHHRTWPKLLQRDSIVLITLPIIWAIVVIERKTLLQHAWIHWLVFLTLVYFAEAALRRDSDNNTSELLPDS